MTPADWLKELRRYRDGYKKDFIDRGRDIVKRYRDDRSSSELKFKRLNLFWSNLQTLKPALFAKVPQAEVTRRHKERDDVSRVACLMLERSLQFEMEYFGDYRSGLSNAIDDRLIVGRGVAWIRYEPKIEQMEYALSEDDLASDPVEQIVDECSPVDYVYWRDFAHDPVRTWEEVTWVARRVFMTKEQGLERFGDTFKSVPLTNRPKDETGEDEKDTVAKAEVWEIWCKQTQSIYWVCESLDEYLDKRDDPYKLECFFPCPKPIYATLTTDSLIPVPDVVLYQDQLDELDKITDRISNLTAALQAKGVYAKDENGLVRMFKEGSDGDMIPIENWMAFAEKGGLKGSYEIADLTPIITVLSELYRDRDACKQIIYEVTGLSDIVRGASVASETATAQNIKSQFASLRLNAMKMDVSRFARDLIRMKAEMMCNMYQPETLVKASGLMNTKDQQFIMPALELLKNGEMRAFNIDIQSDSFVEIDEQAEKQARIEFLQAIGSFMKDAIQAPPQMAPLLSEVMLFAIRSFKVGASIEGVFEDFIEQMQAPQEGPNPAEAQRAEMEQAKMDMERMKLDLEKYKADLDAVVKLEIASKNAVSVMPEVQALDQYSDQIVGGMNG